MKITVSTGCQRFRRVRYRRNVSGANSRPSVVVYSDVDRVLVDPHKPPFARAAAALKELAPDEMALVLCSGKTRAEIEYVQEKLGINHPFICENGGAVLIPDGYFRFDVTSSRSVPGYQAVEFGRAYSDVIEILHRTADDLRIQVVGFSDMSIEEVARECRLPMLHARLAKLREYEEPFRLLSPSSAAWSRLCKVLQGASLRCTRGEDFHRVGAPVERSVGVNLLNSLYRRAGGAVTTVGVTRTMHEDNLVPLVDYPIMVADEDTVPDAAPAAGVIDAIDWAEAIVGTVQELRRNRRPRCVEMPLHERQ